MVTATVILIDNCSLVQHITLRPDGNFHYFAKFKNHLSTKTIFK